MIASKTVYKFANNILKRFETGYDSGTYYLYNVTDDVLWAGNYSCKLLLDLLDGEKNTGELKEEFKNILQIDDINAINHSVDVILQELIQKGMIVEV
ncbi:MAG: hypothetical protein V8R83_02960 [Candidatus Gastranaerophilaceae bacterium]|jgi:hypothetical protein|uniref:PqqD family protein n=1 Tax=Candidatus Limenecus avicola TaxID=2840847 RepID=A0A9D1N120_9CLOT|nr:hypothetical protein [Clostridium sp.]CDC21890.1 unknown [Clostridium sp. CAG:306]DAB25988.1 MAG TPA: hypothetical protein CPT85_02045 [Candidatus Gastranaerophilales bacterium HUM_21]HIU93152.1 hypothetical protein [Candidatus Limenecus avicola]